MATSRKRVSPRISKKSKKKPKHVKPRQLTKKQKKSSANWIRGTGYESHEFPRLIEEIIVCDGVKTPLEMFNMFIDDELLEEITKQKQ